MNARLIVLLITSSALLNGVHCKPGLLDSDEASNVKSFIDKFEFLKLTSLKGIYNSVKESFDNDLLSGVTVNERKISDETTANSTMAQKFIDKFEFLKLTSLKSIYYLVKDSLLSDANANETLALENGGYMKQFGNGGLFQTLFNGVVSALDNYNPFVVSTVKSRFNE